MYSGWDEQLVTRLWHAAAHVEQQAPQLVQAGGAAARGVPQVQGATRRALAYKQ